MNPRQDQKTQVIGDQMKIVFSDLIAPANKSISYSNIPWRWPPCQTRNRAIMGKCNIFKMLSNWLGITKIMVLTYKRIECFFKISSANLWKLDRKQLADRTMQRSFIDYYPGWFLSLCKRVGRGEFSGRLFNKTFWFQKKKQASADHIFENTIRLSPVPFPADFLRNEASAFVRMWLNNPPDGSNILPGDWSPSICYDCFHSWHYNPSGTGTQINSQKYLWSGVKS